MTKVGSSRQFTRRNFLKLGGSGIAGAALLGVAGCGGGETIGSGQGGGGGDTFVFGRGTDSLTLDPIHSTDSESSKVTLQILDTLLAFKPGEVSVVPALATEVPEPEAGGRVYTFRIREGVKFHDGAELNAEAVVFNFERWKNTDNPYHKGGGTQSGDFSRYGIEFGGFDGESNIERVEATGEHTVRLSLKQPQGSFLNDIAIYTFAIASPKAITENVEGFWEKPVGTGPFKFVSWDRDSQIRLERNRDWWGTTVPAALGGGGPKVDHVVIKSIPDNTARVAALTGGELSAADGLTPDDVPTIEQSEDLEVMTQPPLNVGYMAMNLQREPFDDARVRQAVVHAINMPEIVNAFFGETGEVASNPMPSIVPFFNEDVTPYEYDPQESRRLLGEAGMESGFETGLYYMPIPRPYMPDGKGIAQAIQRDLKEVGIEAKLETYEFGTYIEKTGRGDHEMALLGWSGANGDPDTFLNVLLNSATATKESALNISYYKNPEVDRLLESALRSTEDAERRRLYYRAQEIIHEDAPMAPIAYARPPLGFQKQVEGYVPSPVGDRYNNVSLSGR